MALSALIFDVDGTLAETEDLHRRAFNDSFSYAGLSWIWDHALYRQLLAVTGGKERIRHYIDFFGGQPDISSAAVAALHADKTRRYARLVASGAVTLRPGIERLLREGRRADIGLAIATTTSPANVEALLTATLGSDCLGWFTAIAAGDAVAAKKPAPDIYLLALSQLGLPAAECLAFEDTANGLVSARAAGIRTVITMSAFGDPGPFPDALAVVDHLGEPGMPCRVLAGSPIENGYVDLAALARWGNLA